MLGWRSETKILLYVTVIFPVMKRGSFVCVIQHHIEQ
jgi:hypothetical protein